MAAAADMPLRGDEAQLFARYQARLLRTVRRQVAASDALVEDACSFAWMQLLRRQPRRESAYAWLCKVAIHEAYRLSRGERRHAELPEEIDAEHPVSLQDALEARRALRALAGLPERQRRYLTLFAAGHSYADICALTGATYTNVNKHLARARDRVRALA